MNKIIVSLFLTSILCYAQVGSGGLGGGAPSTTTVVNTGIFSQTASVTVGNTVAETTIIGSGVGSTTLQANYLKQGKTLKIRAWGYHSSVSNPNITIRVKIGSTVVLTTGAVASHASTNDGFTIDSWVTCRTTGQTGTVFAQGTYTEISNPVFEMTNTTTSTIDTTASQTIDITVQWGTQSNSDTLTATNVVIESVM